MGAMASQITSLTIVYSTVNSGADQAKHRSSASSAFVRGIHRWQMASNAKMYRVCVLSRQTKHLPSKQISYSQHVNKISNRIAIFKRLWANNQNFLQLRNPVKSSFVSWNSCMHMIKPPWRSSPITKWLKPNQLRYEFYKINFWRNGVINSPLFGIWPFSYDN